jgi:hypothetical protein
MWRKDLAGRSEQYTNIARNIHDLHATTILIHVLKHDMAVQCQL